MEKMKIHDLKGMQFHNQRERESRTNHDIDKSKTELNYDLVNETNIDYNERVKSIIESQKTDSRKIRKDAVVVNELLVTSDKAFFDNLSEAGQRRYFEESYKLFAERYGEKNIAYATVHVDEKTPHMHLGVVPMRDGTLQGKNVFNRQELLWIQNEFPKHMQKLGFEVERGEENSKREHLTVQRFKSETLKEQIKEQVQEIDEKLKELTKMREEIQSSKNHYNTIKTAVDTLETHVKDIDSIEGKKPLMNRNEVLVKVQDFETLKIYAKKVPTIMHENQNLKKDRDFYKSKSERLDVHVSKLTKEKRLLTEQNQKIQNELTIRNRLYSYAKQFLQKFNLFDKFVEAVQKTEKQKEQEQVKQRQKDRDLER